MLDPLFTEFFPKKSGEVAQKAWQRIADEISEQYNLQVKKFASDQKIF